MYAVSPAPRRLPQRVVVAGTPGDALADFLHRLATALDVPLVPLGDLTGPSEVARLAAFDGWVTTAEEAWARPLLLERADLLVRVDLAPTTFAGRVRRTLRRIRSEVREPDLGWVDRAPAIHPRLQVVRVPDPDSAERWLHALS
ncbi:hypothetical protein [Nocardioides daeguensis]|uniref:Adenylate kinase n=1 Tax=Nocardioides daeguensis TaxID=908359 RepID=A0ABP6WJY1_9ACTN|nr:hypothetical protein [Nocardioides daeguensis]MBV6729096.1 hypothetical protein [Nocardioides daeguensis]MCR1774900.1 hypothetical protein [Nocardioides daeguensis]